MSDNKLKSLKLATNLSELRAMVVAMDETAFSKLEKLFDEIANSADAAISLADDLEYDIDWEAEASASSA